MTDRTDELRKIRDEVVDLKESPLYSERIRNKVYPVIGEGNHYAKIMFIGEAPGRTEAATGRPFAGAAGKILDQLLSAQDIDRKDVYITNIVKDRPPMNRDPMPEEVAIYGPFLDRQIEIIQPEVIATLGRYAMEYILNKMEIGHLISSISQIHGKILEAKTGYGQVHIVPLYHPAAAIYNQSLKETLHEDFKVLKQFSK